MKRNRIKELYRLAYIDLMTGVSNRNSYEQHLKKLRKHPELLQGLSVLSADLNGLKEINDRYGHYYGDEAIRHIVSSIKIILNLNDRIFRIGGDEFICFIKNGDYSKVTHLREIINYNDRKCQYHLSASIGFVNYNSRIHKNIDMLIRECDSLMYADKKRQC